ncbi:MAG TPA: hypothetical protein VKB34_23020 [Povalibacter sp.]|nr:hypothetical protein [Povalibacter sp.]
MRRGHCVIVGLDGFDPDVLANLALFYAACGLTVTSSQTPQDCDVLVVQRGTWQGQQFDVHARECHIYDYTWTGTADLHQAFPNIRSIVVISPSATASGKSTPPALIRSFHPVIPALWANPQVDTPRGYGFVHVGHRKPNSAGDAWLEQMDAVVREGSCDVWGNGWDGIADATTSHGPATLHQCQAVYRQARCAFGIMYPFQRGRTISGRAWQAPLNGCVLYSEAIIPDVALPGVERCDDFLGAPRQPATRHKPSDLAQEATQFWENVSWRLAAQLGLYYERPTAVMVRNVYAREVYLRHLNSRARQILRRA